MNLQIFYSWLLASTASLPPNRNDSNAYNVSKLYSNPYYIAIYH